jgi:Flp pilus assembly protein TadB
MSRDQVLLAAIAAGAVAVFSTVMAVTGRPTMWWTVVIMILLLVVFVSRLRQGRKTRSGLGPAQERIDETRL